MNCHSFFSSMRFRLLAKAHFAERKRTYFWFLAVICMIYFFILLMFLIDDRPSYKTHVQAFFYYAGLLTTGYVFALRYFSPMARPASALIQLMQPCSAFEKWLLGAIVIIVIYPIIYTLLFFLMTYPVTQVDMMQVKSPADYQLFIPLTDMGIRRLRGFGLLEQLPLWSAYLSVSGYALTTSLLFKKFPSIISFAVGFCLFLFLLMTYYVVGNNNEYLLIYWFNEQTVPFHSGIFFSNLLVWIGTPLLLWAAGFWALKERDLT